MVNKKNTNRFQNLSTLQKNNSLGFSLQSTKLQIKKGIENGFSKTNISVLLPSQNFSRKSFPLFVCQSMTSDQNANLNFSDSSQEKSKFKKNILNPLNKKKQSVSALRASKQNSRFLENAKQQVVSITYEEIGLFPRSFNRVFDRFLKQLFFDVENLVIQEYRFYRYLFLTTVKCLFILIFVPLGINFLAKNYVIRPVTEYYWNTHNHEIFLNSYQQKQAFREFKNFEEKMYFESLLFSENQLFFEGSNISLQNKNDFHESIDVERNQKEIVSLQKKSISEFSKKGESTNFNSSNLQNDVKEKSLKTENFKFQIDFSKENKMKTVQEKLQSNIEFSTLFRNSLQKRLQIKMFELAKHYNEESIEAVTNFFADILSFGSLCFLLFRLEIQINITKSFLLEVFFGLDDSKKSLLILFVTDLLVGYHSPNIWELFFQTLFDHYGLPESQTTIFLLVATLPVLLDVLFKYLIFRHLNRASPATVATYHAMIE